MIATVFEVLRWKAACVDEVLGSRALYSHVDTFSRVWLETSFDLELLGSERESLTAAQAHKDE